jgi:hypothetical protein
MSEVSNDLQASQAGEGEDTAGLEINISPPKKLLSSPKMLPYNS